MRCVKCGKELSPSAKFCVNCGAQLKEEDKNFDSVLNEKSQEEHGASKGKTKEGLQNGEKAGSAVESLKSNWNDKYTIFVIIGVMVIAAIAGLIVKKANQKKEYENDYGYDDGYEEDYGYEDDYTYEDDQTDEEEYAYEDDYTYEEDYGYEDDYTYEDEYEEESTQEFILPDSSTRFLTKADLYGLSAEECRIARNEIYARHGRMFNDEALQAYFESFDWYYPTIHADDFEESMLNEYEIANRDLIVEYETEQGYR